MPADLTPVLSTYHRDEDWRVAELHAELHAHRLTLLRSILLDPDDCAGREPVWIDFYRLKRDVRNTLDRIKDALSAIGQTAPADPAELSMLPVERADGSADLVPAVTLYPYLGEIERGWMPGDGVPADTMPVGEPGRLPDLAS